MGWIFLAVLASVFTAALAEVNRTLRLDANILNAWRASLACVFLAFFFPWMVWPKLSIFYGIAAIDGIANLVAVFLFLYLAGRKTGRVTSMSIPVSVMIAYFLGWLFLPEHRWDLFENPVRAGLFWISLIAMFWALQKIRRNDNSWESFMMVLPAGMLFGAMFFLRSYTLGKVESVFPLALSYTFVVSIVCAIGAWIRVAFLPLQQIQVQLFDRKMLFGGTLCAFFWVSMFMALLVSLAWTPNPALPAIMLTLTPVWLLGYNKLRRIPDDASIVASMVMVAGAVGLLLSSL